MANNKKPQKSMLERILTHSVPKSQIVQDLVRRMYEDGVNKNMTTFDLAYFDKYFEDEYFYENSSIVLTSDHYYSRLKFRLIVAALSILNAFFCQNNVPAIEFGYDKDSSNYYHSSGNVTSFYFDFVTTEKFDGQPGVLQGAQHPWKALYNYDKTTGVKVTKAVYSQAMTYLKVTFQPFSRVDDVRFVNISHNKNTNPDNNTYSFLKITPVTVGKSPNESSSLSFLYVRLSKDSESLDDYLDTDKILSNVGDVISDVTELELD